jgi:hypothetical protein
MGKVIVGPWLRPDVPKLVSQIEEELRRVIVVLEKSREHRAKETTPMQQFRPLQEKECVAADLA